ncbi:MAG TPA: hypothetical protein VGV91_07625, partial [Rubrobacter sp.]|nr:hypothetical protein [Rubrobacter sp.]
MSTKGANTGVDSHQIMAAGLAATGAAFVTSRFGVAGTLLGAALTAMIITGGSAVLKAYIENAAGRVRSGATRLQGRRDARAGSAAPEPEAPTAQANPPGRPDLRDNFAGRMRAAVEWFRRLPTPARRPILIKALVAAVVALVICLVAIWGVEKLIGNSLSCGIWSNCPYGAAPGVHVAGFDDSGAGSTLSGGNVDYGGGGGVVDSIRQGGGLPDGQDLIPGGADEAPSSASPAADPVQEEAPSSASPAADPALEETPSSASPAAENGAE